MRIAMTDDVFDKQLDSAKREAMKAFGNEVMLLEKFVVNLRNIEVQVFGDMHGNYVYCLPVRERLQCPEAAPEDH